MMIFPKIFDHFTKISKDSLKLSEGQIIVSEHFPKISEDWRRFPRLGRTDDVSIIQELI